MRVAVVLFLLIAAASSAFIGPHSKVMGKQPFPGIRVTSNVRELNKWLARHVDVLGLLDIDLPDVEIPVLFTNVTLRELRIRNVSASGVKCIPQANNRLKIHLERSSFSVHFDTKYAGVHAKGLVFLFNNTATGVVHLDGDNEGKPILAIESLNLTLGSFEFDLAVGNDETVRILKMAIPYIRTWVENSLPLAIIPLANMIIKRELKEYGTVIPLDHNKFVGVDVSLYSRPIFTDKLVQFEMQGIAYFKGAPMACPYTYLKPFDGDRDVDVWIDGGFMNCVLKCGAQADLLNELLANITIPSPLKEPLFYGMKLLPDSDTYVKFRKGGVKSSLHMNLDIFRGLKATASPYFTLGFTAGATLDISFEGTNFKTAVVRGKIHEVDDAISFLAFNNDKRPWSANIKALAASLPVLDYYMNQPVTQILPIPWPAGRLANVPEAATRLFKDLTLNVGDDGFYVGMNYIQ